MIGFANFFWSLQATLRAILLHEARHACLHLLMGTTPTMWWLFCQRFGRMISNIYTYTYTFFSTWHNEESTAAKHAFGLCSKREKTGVTWQNPGLHMTRNHEQPCSGPAFGNLQVPPAAHLQHVAVGSGKNRLLNQRRAQADIL